MARIIPKGDIAQFIQLRRSGLTLRQIADETGHKESTVADQLRAAKVLAPFQLTGDQMATRPYQIPSPRENDDEKHLALIAKARPRGFPVAFSRPHYRVRAA